MKTLTTKEEKTLKAMQVVIDSKRPDTEKITTIKRIIALAESQERRIQYQELKKIDETIFSVWPWLNPQSALEDPE